MNKKIIMLGVFAAIFLMVSSATAVPQVQSKPVMDKVNQVEKIKEVFQMLSSEKSSSKYEALGRGFPMIKLFLSVMSIVLYAILYIITHPFEMLKERIKQGIISKIVDFIAGIILNGIIRFIMQQIFGFFGAIVNLIIGLITGEYQWFDWD